MKIARIKDGAVNITTALQEFPNVSMPSGDALTEFLHGNGFYPVRGFPKFDSAESFAEKSEPYLLDGIVYEYAIVPIQKPTEKELQAIKDAQSVSSRQAHQALILMNKDEEVVKAIASIPVEFERKMVRAWYEQSQHWEYGNETLTQFAKALNIDKDEFFAIANKL